ncbi:glycosyltransferase [Selenomonas sputigena]|uniref:Glycosyltransferase n=1 Tax=Selenomonas sputigena TaxID=69823 RepID=A0ABV3X3N0_9FIRM
MVQEMERDEKKIAIIVARQGEALSPEFLMSLRLLEQPEGFSLELVEVEGKAGMAAAYSQAMEESAAKYKVYMDERVRILEPGILLQIVALFEAQPDIGILGISGTKRLPPDGIAFHSTRRIGSLRLAERTVRWGMVLGAAEDVMALDGFFLATQADLPWREDLFHGAAFFDAAQCLEFRRQGLRAAVLGQQEPLLEFLGDSFPADEAGRQAFLAEYAEEALPLVSILMPTHERPEFFRQALESALAQTYRHIEIIVSDNSEDERTAELMKEYSAEPRIRYTRNRGFSSAKNWLFPLEEARGEYFAYLFDDDLYASEKIERMADVLSMEDGIAFVTSHRRAIDEEGNIVSDPAVDPLPVEETSRIPGELACYALLEKQANFIGEFTTVLLPSSAKETLREVLLQEIPTVLPDVECWLRLLEDGDLLYIVETLSFFRKHKEQIGEDPAVHAAGAQAWARLVRAGAEKEQGMRRKKLFEQAELIEAVLRAKGY